MIADQDNELRQVRQEVNAIRNDKDCAKVRLTLTLYRMYNKSVDGASVLDGIFGSLRRDPKLTAFDVQSLLLYAVVGSRASFKPKWCQVKPWKAISHVNVVLVDGLSLETYRKHEATCFPSISKEFKQTVNFVACPDLVSQLFTVPISPFQMLLNRLKDKEIVKCGDELTKLPESVVSSVLPEGLWYPIPSNGIPDRVFRLDLLLSMLDMVLDQYPLPNAVDTDNFIFSKRSYAKVTNASPIFALDCEMCMAGETSELAVHHLTRISIVDEDCRVVFDSLVKPDFRITDYLTQFSGITKKLLAPVTTKLEDIQRILLSVLPPDAILCGHSFNFDLRALRMFHPYIIDLSTIYNLSGEKGLKSSLATLSANFLGEEIQGSSKGHCSVEDALTTMKLLKLKLANGFSFGNVSLGWKYITFKNAQKRLSSPDITTDPPNSDLTSSSPSKVELFEEYKAKVLHRVDQIERKRRISDAIAEVDLEAQGESSVDQPYKKVKSTDNSLSTEWTEVASLVVKETKIEKTAEDCLPKCPICGQDIELVCRNKRCSCRGMEYGGCSVCILRKNKSVADDVSLLNGSSQASTLPYVPIAAEDSKLSAIADGCDSKGYTAVVPQSLNDCGTTGDANNCTERNLSMLGCDSANQIKLTADIANGDELLPTRPIDASPVPISERSSGHSSFTESLPNVSPSEAFLIQPDGRSECIFEFLKQNSRKLHWVRPNCCSTDAQQCEIDGKVETVLPTADVPDAHTSNSLVPDEALRPQPPSVTSYCLESLCKRASPYHVHESRTKAAGQRICERLLEAEMNVLELKLTDANACGDMLDIDRTIDRVYKTSAKRSLNVVVVSDYARSKNGLCLVRVKR